MRAPEQLFTVALGPREWAMLKEEAAALGLRALELAEKLLHAQVRRLRLLHGGTPKEAAELRLVLRRDPRPEQDPVSSTLAALLERRAGREVDAR